MFMELLVADDMAHVKMSMVKINKNGEQLNLPWAKEIDG